MTQLSVLDLSPIPQGADAAQALRNSRDLAGHAERLGYRRYWLAEHHNMPGVASAGCVGKPEPAGAAKLNPGAATSNATQKPTIDFVRLLMVFLSVLQLAGQCQSVSAQGCGLKCWALSSTSKTI